MRRNEEQNRKKEKGKGKETKTAKIANLFLK